MRFGESQKLFKTESGRILSEAYDCFKEALPVFQKDKDWVFKSGSSSWERFILAVESKFQVKSAIRWMEWNQLVKEENDAIGMYKNTRASRVQLRNIVRVKLALKKLGLLA